MSDVRFFPIGDAALTVEFGNVISPDLNARSIALAECVERDPFPGFLEAVPAYSTVSIFYDLELVRESFATTATAFEAVRHFVEQKITALVGKGVRDASVVKIPVHFGDANGPDLKYVADLHAMPTARVVELFTAQVYRVYMLGFLPGFTYMGMVDEMIATPRRDAPRTRVTRGSVGIAGRQTGVYSLDSPGGWQIIGRTEVEMFTPNAARPTYLKPGDQVRFIAA